MSSLAIQNIELSNRLDRLHEEQSKLEEQQEDPYKDWWPQQESFCSVLNVGGDDGTHPAFKLLGAQVPLLDECPFNDKKGGCYKGNTCRLKHPCEGEQEAEKTPIQSYYFNDLPKKHSPRQNATFWAEVVSVDSPFEFFMLPIWNFDCDCGRNPNVGKNDLIRHAEYFRVGKVPHKEINEGLQRYYSESSKYTRLQNTFYMTSELVNCFTTKYGWARGVVLDDASLVQDIFVAVYLLDYGEYLNLPFHEVTGTVKALIETPALVYKCTLYGISPVGYKYSRRACEFFEELVKNRYVRANIINRPRGNITRFTEVVPYVVDLVIKIDNELVRVADLLAKSGLAMPFNPYPARPKIFTTNALSLRDALILEVTPEVEEIQQNLLRTELQRGKEVFKILDIVDDKNEKSFISDSEPEVKIIEQGFPLPDSNLHHSKRDFNFNIPNEAGPLYGDEKIAFLEKISQQRLMKMKEKKKKSKKSRPKSQ